MASLQSIAKAQAVGIALYQVFGVDPSYEYSQDYARVYFQPDRLLVAQRNLEKMVSASGPDDVRVDWLPVVAPLAIKKAFPIAAGLLLGGYLLGRFL